jgi:hypothetical protein
VVNLDKQLESTSASEPTSEKPHSYRRFSGWFLAAAAIPMVSMAGFNAFVNPYGVFESPTIDKFNQAKPAKLNNMRMFKAVEVSRIEPNMLFLGSSRTDYGMNPQHPALAQQQPAYNLGLGASNTLEMRLYLEHVLARTDVDLVVIGLDEFMFNTHNDKNVQFERYQLGGRGLTIRDAVNTTFSLDALAASLETLSMSREYPDYVSYSPQGQLNLRPLDRDPSATDYRFGKSLSVYFESFPQPYALSQDNLAELQKIIEIAQRENIELRFFISPSHATRYEAIRTAGHWEAYEQMKREIAQITPFWDFSGYNSITKEAISPDMQHYIDDSHYRSEVGDLVLNKLLNYQSETVPQDFGVLVTPENVESHLANIRRDRKIWAQNNADEIQFVRQTYQSVDR